MDSALLDLIYEAAAVPENWPGALERLGQLAKTRHVSLFALDVDRRVAYTATDVYRPTVQLYADNAERYDNPRPRRALASGHAGFLMDREVQSPEELARDPIYRELLLPAGLHHTSGSVIAVPTGDILVFDVARSDEHGVFTRAEMEVLDPYRPHLARAALLAHRLGLRASSSATEALQLVGLPAAALTESGRVLIANPLFEQLAPRVAAGAFDRVSFASRAANSTLQQVLGTASLDPGFAARSIPIPAADGAPALIAHLVPIRRTAHDIFSRAAFLLVLTAVVAPEAPLTEMLHGLFDLTPAEARVARELAAGLSVEEISRKSATSKETVRTQLKGVMAKTATSRQAELVRLLAGASPLTETGS
jgi:DNA-binding CsgD family transcriptional regulator